MAKAQGGGPTGKSPRSKSAAGKTTAVGGSAGPRGLGVKLRNPRSHSSASQRWLSRQLNDPYVTAAKAQGFRSRSAFKLMQMDDRFHLLRRGLRVVELGAAPGGWTQVAVLRGAARVVGVDLLAVEPIDGATFIQGDFNDPDMPDRLSALLGGAADLVLSDMAPNTTGHSATDSIRIIALAERALDFAAKVLRPGGAFVAKVLQGGTERQMLQPMKRLFAAVRHAKPPASRKNSSELYVVATGFRGSRSSDPEG